MEVAAFLQRHKSASSNRLSRPAGVAAGIEYVFSGVRTVQIQFFPGGKELFRLQKLSGGLKMSLRNCRTRAAIVHGEPASEILFEVFIASCPECGAPHLFPAFAHGGLGLGLGRVHGDSEDAWWLHQSRV